MDADAALDVLRDAARDLADASADLDRIVPTYPGWTVADLVVHTGRIHRWVAEIVASRAAQRLPKPELGQRPDDLLAWFRDGTDRVIDTLAATSPTTPVWTFAGEHTAGFWRRRMALETTIHRWDAQRAAGHSAQIAGAVAVAGVSEALQIYLVPRLQGADVGGRGEIVSLRTADGVALWAVRLRQDAIDVLTDDPPADVRVEATPSDLWLFLMGRAGREVLDVHGPVNGVDRLQRAVALLPTPAG